MTYLPYAGIGSRSTPRHILDIMCSLAAHLCEQGWILRSGGAHGADAAFEAGVDAYVESSSIPVLMPTAFKEIYLPWAGFNNNPSPLHPGAYPFSEQEIELASQYHPAWNRCSPAAQKLHTRNLRQIVGHPSVAGPIVQLSKFVVCWTENGAVTGGTSQALRMAMSMHIPIINLGKARNASELEALVLEVDKLQAKLKQEVIS